MKILQYFVSKCGITAVLLVFMTALFVPKAGAAEPLPVVVTLPVLKDFVAVVGDVHIRVSTLISGSESEHTYTPKPSDLVRIQKAKVLFQIGLDLELWVQPLIENADRPNLPIVTTSKGVSLIEGGPVDGHGHGAANPHIWLDPQNVQIMIAEIKKALIAVDPEHQADYEKNASAYLQKLEKLEAELKRKVAPLKDKRIITHHPAWPYFAKRFGFEIRSNILTQIGSAPSAKKLGILIRQIKKEKIRVIVSEPQLNQKIPLILAEETGAKVVPLSPLTGALPGTDHYLDLMRYNVQTLVDVLEKVQ
ncbi:Zinc ABC transporter, substrate-binding protein ZnuA [hydrothermal vent metagenome]|uniref:Zinc ABC transporter, substrate-binding protein ZnuA n=1 Tax=hydrothermal vent metagenome TaxID=652676 RepID=A0A3B1D792_9ZZZZ